MTTPSKMISYCGGQIVKIPLVSVSAPGRTGAASKTRAPEGSITECRLRPLMT